MSKRVLPPGFGVLRLIVLAVAVLLEAAAVLSVVSQTAFVPLGAAYPNAISITAYVLPTVVGFLCQRFEAAIVLAVLPFWTMVLIYVGVYAPVYNTDLLQLGTLAGPVAGSSFLLAGLGLLGWMVRRAVVARGASAVKAE